MTISDKMATIVRFGRCCYGPGLGKLTPTDLRDYLADLPPI
jgi:hypothetical protein